MIGDMWRGCSGKRTYRVAYLSMPKTLVWGDYAVNAHIANQSYRDCVNRLGQSFAHDWGS
ncbi:hypothetical protein DSUL_100226 [Desulfovibrionales bacterium]